MNDRFDDVVTRLRADDTAPPPTEAVLGRARSIRRHRVVGAAVAVALVAAAPVALFVRPVSRHSQVISPPTVTATADGPTIRLSPTDGASVSQSGTPTGSAEPSPSVVLPDGSTLPAGCTSGSAQSTTPSADQSYVAAVGGCGVGQFSVVTGAPLRWLSADGGFADVAPDGDVAYRASDDAGESVYVVHAGAVSRVVGPVAAMRLFSETDAGPIWGTTTASENPVVSTVHLPDGTVLRVPKGSANATVDGAAMSDDGTLAVAFQRFDVRPCKTADSGDCLHIVTAGISLVAPGGTAIPEPTILVEGCRFGALAWRSKELLATRICGGDSAVVTIEPGDTGPSGDEFQPTKDPITGLRVMSNGDVLIAATSRVYLWSPVGLPAIQPPSCGDACSTGIVAVGP